MCEEALLESPLSCVPLVGLVGDLLPGWPEAEDWAVQASVTDQRDLGCQGAVPGWV